MAQTITQSANRRRFRLLKRFLLFAVGGFGFLFILAAILILPDQIRPIPQPKIDLVSLAPSIARTEASVPSTLEEGAKGETETSATLESLRSGVDMGLSSLEELQMRFRPVPDLSGIDKKHCPLAEELNRSMDTLTSAVLSLLIEPEKADYWATRRMLDAIQPMNKEDNQAMDAIASQTLSRFFADPDSQAHIHAEFSLFMVQRKGVQVYQYAEKEFPQTGKESLEDNRFNLGNPLNDRNPWNDICGFGYLRLKKEYAGPIDMAGVCMYFAGFPEPDKTSPGWKAEVYYWRKGGVAGRCYPAARSASPLFARPAWILYQAFRNPDSQSSLEKTSDSNNL